MVAGLMSLAWHRRSMWQELTHVTGKSGRLWAGPQLYPPGHLHRARGGPSRRGPSGHGGG